ncbi:translation initiation factor IF-2-like [Trachypithecus francoisi]|uniref:translation initiation factor IF-2-like n=1 Tax=Trachypithecus francoisi TaxID=54180 RepID=UPI00141AC4D4|nr:translation initiation factor IF-2-like [Trachypithecus francoisi]
MATRLEGTIRFPRKGCEPARRAAVVGGRMVGGLRVPLRWPRPQGSPLRPKTTLSAAMRCPQPVRWPPLPAPSGAGIRVKPWARAPSPGAATRPTKPAAPVAAGRRKGGQGKTGRRDNTWRKVSPGLARPTRRSRTGRGCGPPGGAVGDRSAAGRDSTSPHWKNCPSSSLLFPRGGLPGRTRSPTAPPEKGD